MTNLNKLIQGIKILLCISILVLASCRLVIINEGNGSVSSSSGAYDCNDISCTTDITGNDFIDTFTAEPDPGNTFLGWQGGFSCEGTVVPCSVFLPALFTELPFSFELKAIYAQEGSILLYDYMQAGSIGDRWEFVDDNGDISSWTRTAVTAGAFKGQEKMGDEQYGFYIDKSQQQLTLYWNFEEDDFGTVALPKRVQPGEVLDIGAGSLFTVVHVTSITTIAGSFSDGLAMFWLDENYSPNSVNLKYGLDDYGVSAGVTDVDLYAKGVGYVKFEGVSAANGEEDGGSELSSSTVLVLRL